MESDAGPRNENEKSISQIRMKSLLDSELSPNTTDSQNNGAATETEEKLKKKQRKLYSYESFREHHSKSKHVNNLKQKTRSMQQRDIATPTCTTSQGGRNHDVHHHHYRHRSASLKSSISSPCSLEVSFSIPDTSMYEVPFHGTDDTPERTRGCISTSSSTDTTHSSPEQSAATSTCTAIEPFSHTQHQHHFISQDPIPTPRPTNPITNANGVGSTPLMEEIQRNQYVISGMKFRSLLDQAFQKVATGYSQAVVVQNEEGGRMDDSIHGGIAVVGESSIPRSASKRPLEEMSWDEDGREERNNEDYKPLSIRRLDLVLGSNRREETELDTKYASELVHEKIKEIMVLKRVSVTMFRRNSPFMIFFVWYSFESQLPNPNTNGIPKKDIERSRRTHSCYDTCQFNVT